MNDSAPDGSQLPEKHQLPSSVINSDIFQLLHERPRTSHEMPGKSFSKLIRPLIGKVKSTGVTKNTPEGDFTPGRAYTVYYLYGDERRAVRRFIEANEQYVRTCFRATNNRLVQELDGPLYNILCEEWQIGGYGDSDSD